MRIDPQFVDALSDYNILALDRSMQAIVAIDGDYRLRFINHGWDQFAIDNASESIIPLWPLGRSILEGISDTLRKFYIAAFENAASKHEVFQHTYQCPTPTLDRTFTMTVYPLKTRGWLIVHAQIIELVHEDATRVFDDRNYVDGDGIVHQCANCRKVRRNGSTDEWNWIPSLIAHPHPKTSHGLCEACLGFYYPATPPASQR